MYKANPRIYWHTISQISSTKPAKFFSLPAVFSCTPNWFELFCIKKILLQFLHDNLHAYNLIFHLKLQKLRFAFAKLEASLWVSWSRAACFPQHAHCAKNYSESPHKAESACNGWSRCNSVLYAHCIRSVTDSVFLLRKFSLFLGKCAIYLIHQNVSTKQLQFESWHNTVFKVQNPGTLQCIKYKIQAADSA